MYGYDLNGLELTPMAETLNSYFLTAVQTKLRKYEAYAAGTSKKNVWTKHRIGMFNDPRDAAFVAQEFARIYSKDTVDELVRDGNFAEVAKEFRETIEIPEWKYPAEGLDFDDIEGGSYKLNYVNNARDALVEAIKVLGKKVPSIADAKKMISKVEDSVAEGMTYRTAAHQLVERI